MSKKVFLLIVVACVLVVGKVYALQITVDGDPSDWTPAASVATSPLISSPPAGWDVAEVFFTNDSDNFYWRIDTYAAPEWSLTPNEVILQICMNTDNDTSTGVNLIGSCNNSPTEDFGFDYVILVYSNNTSQPTIETYACSPNCDVPASPAQVASIGTVTEIGIPLSDLNISGCTSGADCIIPTTVYSTQFPVQVDWVPAPDETFNVALPGPTAVSLNTFSVVPTSTNNQLWLIGIVFGLLLVGLFIFLQVKKRVIVSKDY